MKYTITINQKAILENLPGLDLVDASILNCLMDGYSMGYLQRKDEIYFWVHWKYIKKELPICGLNTRDSIVRRFRKLKDKKALAPHPKNQKLGKAYYKFTEEFKRVIFGVENETEKGGGVEIHLQGCRNSSTGGVEIHLHNKYTNYNTTNYNNYTTAEQKKVLEFITRVDAYYKLYDAKMLDAFCVHWLERNYAGKKFRYEGHDFFDVPKRLATWKKLEDGKYNRGAGKKSSGLKNTDPDNFEKHYQKEIAKINQAKK